MRKIKHSLLATILLLPMISIAVHAQVNPMPLATDSRIRTASYQNNEVYSLRGVHGYQTTIQLNADEIIENVDLGDGLAWTLNIGKNNVTLKPIADIANTNMTIRTNKRLYLFQLTTPTLQRNENGEPIFSNGNNVTYLLRFHYPEPIMALGTPRPAVATGVVTPPSKVNNRYYSARGNDTILPRAVYDDGEFTYFDYTGISPIPNIYIVGDRKKEYVVNKRMEGHWIVVEKTAKQFTIRNGTQVASIFNDMIVKK